MIAVTILMGIMSFAFAEPLRINASALYPRTSPDGSGFEDRIVSEALSRLGHSYIIVSQPAERALVSVNSGVIDGDYDRVAGLEAQYPNLIMVEEPISSMSFCAFTKADSGAYYSWESLRDVPLGIIIGWKILEERTKDFSAVRAVRDEQALFALLLAGHVDVVIYDLLGGRYYLAGVGAEKSFVAGPPLDTKDMYLYLNKRHAALAASLTTVLRAMRRDGTIGRLTAEVVRAQTR